MAFLKRLVPAGLPRDIVEQMRTYQAADPYCIRMKNEVRLATEWATRRQVRAETAVRDGKVTLRLSPVAAVDAKRAAKLEAVLAEFVVGECGMLYHLGEGRDGRAVVEYVVPVAQHQVVLQSAHDGMLHLGRARTLDAVRGSRLWWPSLAADVKRYVKKCPTCAFNKVPPHRGEMHIPPNGLKPWQVVTVDVVDLEDTASGNREAVIFSDRFSRSVRAFAVPRTLSSEMFLNIVAFGLIPDVGVPLMMISDRGSNLISKLCEEFYKEFGGIDPVKADAHMHTAVGLTERFNSTLREMARAAWFDSKCEWDLYLPYLVMFHNATVQASTGFSPFYMEHGREPSLPWHPDGPPSEWKVTPSEYVNKHLLGLHLAWEALMTNVENVEKARKMKHDAKYQTNVTFKPGDRVLMLQPGRRSKMEMPYVGPYRVLWGPDERDRYALRDLHGRRFNEFHVSKLKLWPDDEEIDDEHYIVEHILDSRDHNGERQYLVKWQGWAQRYNSWEPIENLNLAARLEAAKMERDTGCAHDHNHEATAASGGSSSAAGEGAPQPDTTSKKKEKKKAKAAADGAAAAEAESAPPHLSHTQLREERAAARAAAKAHRLAAQ
jgi:hypothetical protein